MSRRRKIEIKASELACFDTLVETLRTRPEFADLDPTSLHVWAYENYEPTIRNAARAIRHFDHWLAAQKNASKTKTVQSVRNNPQLLKAKTAAVEPQRRKGVKV